MFEFGWKRQFPRSLAMQECSSRKRCSIKCVEVSENPGVLSLSGRPNAGQMETVFIGQHELNQKLQGRKAAVKESFRQSAVPLVRQKSV